MSDHSELYSRAQAAIDELAESGQRWPEGDDWFEPELCSAELEFVKAASPQVIKALIAENERLRNLPTRNVLLRDREKLIDQRNELKAEIAGLKTGYEAYERVNAELKAEVEGLESGRAKLAGELSRLRAKHKDWTVDAALGQGEQS